MRSVTKQRRLNVIAYIVGCAVLSVLGFLWRNNADPWPSIGASFLSAALLSISCVIANGIMLGLRSEDDDPTWKNISSFAFGAISLIIGISIFLGSGYTSFQQDIGVSCMSAALLSLIPLLIELLDWIALRRDDHQDIKS